MINGVEKFGKILYEFDIPRVEWEMDCKGWICVDETGNRVIVLSKHNNPYIASLSELLGELDGVLGKVRDMSTALMIYSHIGLEK